MIEVLKKVTIVLILIMFLMNSSLLIIISTAIDAIEGIIDENKINILHEVTLEKYVNYKIEGASGTLLQYNLKAGIEYLDDETYRPLNKMGILLNIPKINDEYPEDVQVIGISTKVTNGSNNASDFSFVYDKDLGDLKIVAVNREDEDGNIYTDEVADARDEYAIICYYSSNCYDESKIERDINLTGFIQINVADENETIKKENIEENYKVSENISDVISTKVTTTDIYNGYINSNKDNGTDYKTEYTENFDINISYKELSDEMYITSENNFVNNKNEIIDTDEIIYKSTIVNKNNVLYILGEDGFLEILDENGESLAIINKDTKVDDNENYEVVYKNDLRKITIKTSRPLNVGTISLENEKQIKETMTNIDVNRILTKNSVRYVNNIEIEVENDIEKVDENTNKQESNEQKNIIIEKREIHNYSSYDIADIKDAQTKIDLTLDKTQWTNNVQNKVNFEIKMIANSSECRLFNNPIIELELPEEVDKIIIGETFLLYANGLNLENVMTTEQNGIKFIRAELSGEQKGYNNNDMIDGAEFIIPTTVIIKKDISSTNSKVKVNCLNNKEIVSKEHDVNIISVVKIDEDREEKEDQIPPLMISYLENAQNEDAKLSLDISTSKTDSPGNQYIYIFKIKNKTNSTITNIVADIIMPENIVFVEERSFLNEVYGWTVEETTTGVEINVPTLEANEEKECWVLFQTLKLNDEFNFEIQTYGTIKGDDTDTYYSNLHKETIHTYELEVIQTNQKEGQELHPDEEIEYNFDIKDISSEEYNYLAMTLYITNYADQNLIPVSAIYTQKTIDEDTNENIIKTGEFDFSAKYVPEGTDPSSVPDLNATLGTKRGDEISLTLKFKAKEVLEETEVSNCIKIRYNDYGDEHVITSNIIKNKIIPRQEEKEPDEPKERTYSISGFVWEDTNKNGQYDSNENKLENILVKLINPETGDVLRDDDGYNIVTLTDKNGEYKFENLRKSKYAVLFEYDSSIFTVTIYKNSGIPESKNSNVTEKTYIENNSIEKKVAVTNVLDINDINVEYINMGLVEKSNEDNTDEPSETEIYSISGFAWEDINKNGQYDNNENRLSGIIVKLINLKTGLIAVNKNNKELSTVTDSNGNYTLRNVDNGEYIVLFEYNNDIYYLTTYKVNGVSENKNSNVVNKKITMNDTEVTANVSDTLTILDKSIENINIGLIKNESGNIGGSTDNPTTSAKYSISGFAWEDVNKNGKYDNNENKLSKIIVKLFNSDTNEIVKDSNGNNLEVKTNENGEYIFENISSGNYLVLFEYDSNQYSLTAYKKSHVLEEINSDAVKKQVSIDGVSQIVGLTDILTIIDNNLNYINIGLVKNENFDLALNKSITKLIVKYDGNSKEYNYNESKLVKVEIPAKKIAGATIEVEYQIKITNEGDLSGYVDEIIDYLPDGFSFDSTKNNGWTQTSNNTLKNTTYAGNLINSGETKIVTLIVTRKLTSESIGTLRNSAEILKSGSINGDADIDSSTGNKLETEDDYSTAELIISVKTGAIIYTGTMVLILAIIIILKLLIDKKIINLKKLKIFSILLLCTLIMIIPSKEYTLTIDSDSSVNLEDAVRKYVDSLYGNDSIDCYYYPISASDYNQNSSYDWISNSGNYYRCVNYTHHNKPTINGVLYCDQGGDMGYYTEAWCYYYDSCENIQCSGTTDNSITNTSASISAMDNAKYYPYYENGVADSKYYIVGPFRFTANGDKTTFDVKDSFGNNISYEVYGNVSGTSKLNEIPVNSDFYLKVDKNVFTVRVTGNTSRTSKKNYNCTATWVEIWKRPYGYPGQILKRNKSGNLSGTIDVSTSDSTTVTASIPIGDLTIEKKDYDYGTLLSGYKITVEEPYYHYSKTIELFSDQTSFNIANLPVYESNGTTKLKYTITEISAPSGYNLNWQQEKTVTTTIEKDKKTKINSFRNRQFMDLYVNKKMLGTNINMSNVGFKIYIEILNGTTTNGLTRGWLTQAPSGNPLTSNGKVNLSLTSSENQAKTFYTDTNGQMYFSALPMGTYTIKEVSLPNEYSSKWYNMSGSITYSSNSSNVGIDSSGTKKVGTVTVYDTIKRGHLKLIKSDYDTDTNLSGAQFNITNYISGDSKLISNEITNTSNPRYTNVNVTIPARGELYIGNLPIGVYKITEIRTPDEYLLNLQFPEEKVKYVTVYEDSAAITESHQSINTSIGAINNTRTTQKIKNRKYGNLVIEKVDEAKKNVGGVWNNSLTSLEDLIFSNVKFKIYYTTPTDSTKRYITNFMNKTNEPSTFSTTTNSNSAQLFITGNDGTFRLDNIPAYYSYHVIEVDIPDEMAQYYNVKTSETNVTALISNWKGQNTVCDVTNKQLRVDLEGYVWEDIAVSKTTTRNNLYDVNSTDKRVDNITVYLKKNGTIIAKRMTDSNGMYFFPAIGKYYENSGNEYTIIINELNRYSIEFEYNGLKYENVLTNITADNGSKAKEDTARRNNFNNEFNNILGNKEKNKGNSGITSTNIGLNYTNGNNYNSELVQNTGYTSESLKGSVDFYANTSAIMKADTNTAGFTIQWGTGVRVVRNINFGIYERTQPDLAIATDIEDIKLTINGEYSHTYEYKKRSANIDYELSDSVLNNYLDRGSCQYIDEIPGYDRMLDAFSVSVKNGRGDYQNCTYIRGIYDSYIAYTKNDQTSDKRLRVYITYKTVVKNESGSLYSKVSLRNYVDSRLDIIDSYYIKDNGNYEQLNWKENSTKKDYTERYTDEKDLPIIKPTESITVYIIYELNTETIVSLANLKDNNELSIKDYVTEINSYSSYYSNGNKYGGIDKDSAPDNLEYGNVNTYEDDTDVAPSLKFKRQDTKQLEGLVFEDSTESSQLRTGQERKGNSKYELSENKIENVKVEVIECNSEESITKLYTLDNEGKVVITDAQGLTGQDGKYSIVGLIPGQYYIKYTYGYFDSDGEGNYVQSKIGNKNITTESYKSTIVDPIFKNIINFDSEYKIDHDITQMTNDYETQFRNGTPEKSIWYWYQNSPYPEYSSAVDDYSKRLEINDKLSNITYETKTGYDDVTNDEYAYIRYMDAYTGVFDFAIEDVRVQTTNVDYESTNRDSQIKFGIVERPRESLEVYKEVTSAKITLANGQVLIEGDPRNSNMDFVTYPDGGPLKIEIDSEIIEGATLDIEYGMKVGNKSEIDYNDRNYYIYGTVPTGQKAVDLKISSLVDYLDEKLSVSYSVNTEDSNIIYYDGEWVDNKWLLINDVSSQSKSEEHKLAGVTIDENVWKQIKGRSNVLVRSIEQTFAIKETTSTTLEAKKLLTNLVNDDQLFNNYIEILRVYNVLGRFYGENRADGSWKVDTPGNFNIYETTGITKENDNNEYRRSQTTIVPPTGEKTIIMYSIAALGTLAILVGGTLFIIKKKHRA